MNLRLATTRNAGRFASVLSLAAASLLATAAVSVVSAQSANPVDRFEQVFPADGSFSTLVPAVLDGGKRVRVVVILSADSVATARSKVPTKKLAAGHLEVVEKAVEAQQAAVKPMLAAHGAKVLSAFKHALNGIKVDVEKSRIAALAAMPGVVAVVPVGVYAPNNSISVPYLGAPTVWQGTPGFRGEGVKIAVIDTGIDYTHANFGGPGTVAAYNAAAATSAAPANPAYFGPAAPKVKGGTDLVGDSYNADSDSAAYQPVPHPDPNPLDCEGHGSHVAGTATGLGVLNGTTYTGAYNNAAYQQHFDIGPGVAPRADLYAVRVFGCAGSTEVVTEAIDWAVAHNMDVINMSLGSNWGDKNTADAIASQNAALAGITVVASAGNAGSAPYINGSPASSASVISVAAMDATSTFPGVNIALNTGPTLVAINANNAPLPTGSLPIVVLRNANNTVSLGCNEAEYPNALVAGKLVVTLRGTCDRVARAMFGQRHGAAAVVMINTDTGFPPFENTIPGVTIPFLGVPSTSGPALVAAASATLSSAGGIANPGFQTIASFSSGGPRYGDSLFKPNVTAPGVSTFSTSVGSGNQGKGLSGTSMAAPHVAGVAALVRQAHSGWSELAQRAALTQTAKPSLLSRYSPRLSGSGVVQPVAATNTQAVVLGTADQPDPLSFGFAEFTSPYFNALRSIDIRNNGTSAVQFSVKTQVDAGVPHLMALESGTVTVPPGGNTPFRVKMQVPASNVGGVYPLGSTNGYKEVAGHLTLTPAEASMNGGASLTVPYYLAPHARSLVQVSHNVPTPASPSATLSVTNGAAPIAGTADFYAWGLSGVPRAALYVNTRAVGVQSNPLSASDTLLVFAINTFSRFSNAAAHEWDIVVDTNGDGQADFIILAIDVSAAIPSQPAGRLASVVFNVNTGAIVAVYFADAPSDGSTILLPVKASDLGLTPANPRFSYSVEAFNFSEGSTDPVPGLARFNAFAPAISTAMFAEVAPSSAATVPVSINATEWAITPSLGIMAVFVDNLSGAPQADLVPVPQ